MSDIIDSQRTRKGRNQRIKAALDKAFAQARPVQLEDRGPLPQLPAGEVWLAMLPPGTPLPTFAVRERLRVEHDIPPHARLAVRVAKLPNPRQPPGTFMLARIPRQWQHLYPDAA